MYRQFVIFFLFYLTGAVLSPAFANTEWGLEKNLIFFCDDAFEDGKSIDELLRSLHEFDGDDHPVIAIISHRNSSSSLEGVLSLGHQLLQSDRVVQRSLFLIFHSFLFYDRI